MVSTRSSICRILFVVTVILVTMNIVAPVDAQKRTQSTDPETRLNWYEQFVASKEKSLFKNLEWQFIGPEVMSGRVTDVAVPKQIPFTIYAATASGGVWKTSNEGTTWEPILQHAASTSVGAVSVAPSDPDLIWVGLGEANIFRSSMSGTGVYKSTDAGKTWSHKGLTDTQHIGRIVIHPQNPDIVYVAASGHEYTDNKERGVYKTTDGGEAWEKVLYINEKTGIIDLVMDPSESNILYASAWDRIRKPWSDPKPGENDAIYKTTDAGKTWNKIINGLPNLKLVGRIGLDVSRTNPNVIYALLDNHNTKREPEEGELDAYGRPRGKVIFGAEVYRSDDKGENWRKVNEDSELMEGLFSTYGWVFGQIRVDPNDENTIYVMGVPLLKSTDGGKTFKQLDYPGLHGDHHAMWIDPDNSNYIVNGNDGGVNISYDGGETWINYENLPVVQFYNVAVDMEKPFHVYGSIQDNDSWRGIVDLSRGRNKIPQSEWETVPGGEASYHAVDPSDNDVLYSESFYGRIQRSKYVDGEWQTENITPKAAEGEPKLRGQWLAPFIISPHNPFIIYHGMQYLFRSMYKGENWEKISPDLTYNNPEAMGDIPYQTITTISESPLQFGLIYVGTDDGKVHVTRDGGHNWREVMKGLPYKKWVSRVVASAYDKATVYLSMNGKRDDDFADYLYKSTDYGQTWVDISANIAGGPINVIKEDPQNENILYVGTDLGVYVSLNSGKSWQVLADKMPTTFVHDLAVHPRDHILIAATHGRGMYVMDVKPLQQMDETILAKNVHLFEIDPAKVPKEWWQEAVDAVIYYYLKEPKKVNLSILDEADNPVKTIEQDGDAGLNVATWDLTLKTEETTDEEKEMVEPGMYKVKLSAGSNQAEREFEVK